MRSKTIYNSFILFIFLTLINSNQLFAQSETSLPDTLIVGVAGSQPFVFPSSAENKGIAVDIWEDLAAKKQ